MKKLLIIALLVVGCEDAPTEHTHDGICVSYNDDYWGDDTFRCYNYPELTHKDCLTSSDVNYLEYDWYTDITCEEFCEEKWNVHLNNGQKDSTTCYIDDEMPVFIP